jgi:hypothetical protein
MPKTITLAEAEQISDAADLDSEAIRSDYSGRGMYGQECLGFTYSTDTDLLYLGAALSAHFDGDIPSCRTDSLGMGGIVYFPSLTVVD